MTYLLDTNVISELVKPKPHASVVNWVNSAESSALYISVLTLGEIRKGIVGIADIKRHRKIATWLEKELPAYFEEGKLTDYVKKPILSREGANIDMVMKNISLQKTEGSYGAEGYIYQDLFTLPNYSNHYPGIGSWVIGQQPAGMGIRESDSLITDNVSRFVPHVII